MRRMILLLALWDQWSANNWLPSTSATTAFYRRKLIEPYVKTSCDDMSALPHISGKTVLLNLDTFDEHIFTVDKEDE